MSKSWNAHKLSKEQNTILLQRAKAVCKNWWADVLDCRCSFMRQPVELTFDEIMSKYDGSYLTIIHRNNPPEDHLEISFRVGTPNEPEYFLWLILDASYIPEFTKGLELYE